jgi:hypothetical protein
MSTLNFEIGTLVKDDTKLLINNKTLWNKGVILMEVIFLASGLYLLLGDSTTLAVENFFESSISKIAGFGLIIIAIFVVSSPHLEQLIFDRIQREVIVIESKWFGLYKNKYKFNFSCIIALNVKAEYSESVWLHSFWLDLGEGNYLPLGKTSDERVSEVVEAISSILELDHTQIKHWGKQDV